MNAMQAIKLEKITLNIGCGDDQQKIDKAVKLLSIITGEKPVITKSRRRSTFNIPKGKPLGVMVTLRGKKAEDLLRIALQAAEKKVKKSQFSADGNFNLGIKSYIDMPGVKYQHEIGLLGMDVAVTLERAGYRIKKRKIQKRRIPAKHLVNAADVSVWLKEKFGVEVV